MEGRFDRLQMDVAAGTATHDALERRLQDHSTKLATQPLEEQVAFHGMWEQLAGTFWRFQTKQQWRVIAFSVGSISCMFRPK